MRALPLRALAALALLAAAPALAQDRLAFGLHAGAGPFTVPVTLSESSTKRWFTGYADITLVQGENTITAMERIQKGTL